MESSNTKLALTELARVHKLATKLRTHLHQPPQLGLCRALTQEMLYSVEKAIHAAKSAAPRPTDDERLKTSKNRKMEIKWTSHVKGGSEVPPDGHSWRKYGQKIILGSKHPRAYYRCTHQKRGCPAMKQVQRTDHNPWLFRVTYLGTHTCTIQMAPKPHLGELNGLGSTIETCDIEARETNSSWFSPSTQANPEDDLFCSSPKLDGCFPSYFSSAFASPTTSGSNQLPWSPFQDSNRGAQEADLMDIISAAISAPVMDMNLAMQGGEFDTSIFLELNSVS
ncbi:hypothetical protein HPP92_028306 [Vanilla planifolia]|uniref:WRKY domain-containing protein n=1 Tax=Vanilla planifolia TaxID=51239 RepID=A0A835U626_VANPL|nr:hypothetical protein HPP92_028306 [Vanilla planifolia]